MTSSSDSSSSVSTPGEIDIPPARDASAETPSTPDRANVNPGGAFVEDERQAMIGALPQVVRNRLATGPTVTLMLVNPDEAEAMKGAVDGVANAGALAVWEFNSDKSIATYTTSIDHWNAIPAIATIVLLEEQRRFPLLFGPTPSPARAVQLISETLTTKLVLAIAGLIASVIAVQFVFGYEPYGESSVRSL